MAPTVGTSQCILCNKNLTKKQASVQCGLCLKWFHVICAKVSQKSFDAIASDSNLLFKCPTACSKDDDSGNTDVVGNDNRLIHEKMDNMIDLIFKKLDDKESAFNEKLENAICELKSDLSATINNNRSEISKCNSAIAEAEAKANNRFAQIEIDVNALHRKFNRNDIIVNGLPAGLSNLNECISNIASYYEVPLHKSDLNNISYINKGRSVIVKFNNVGSRDAIMKAYFKSKSLNLANVMGGEISSRVYLNDNLPPASSRLNILAKRLQRQKKIMKYWLPHSDKPIVQITHLDGTVSTCNYDQCLSLL